MRGDEQRIVDAFCRHLEQERWRIEREVESVDVVAEREGVRMYVEAKGRSASVGLDVDTMYGQILRRMPLEENDARFALVVPVESRRSVLRVNSRVRGLLRLEVYTVDANGRVERVD